MDAIGAMVEQMMPGEQGERGRPEDARTVPTVPGPASPGPEPTGDERVDQALARLGDLAGAPVEEHVAAFEDVHQRLQDALAATDEQTEEPGEPGELDGGRREPPA